MAQRAGWTDTEIAHSLRVALDELAEGAEKFDDLVATKPDKLFDELIKLDRGALRRIVLDRVLAEQRQRAAADKS